MKTKVSELVSFLRSQNCFNCIRIDANTDYDKTGGKLILEDEEGNQQGQFIFARSESNVPAHGEYGEGNESKVASHLEQLEPYLTDCFRKATTQDEIEAVTDAMESFALVLLTTMERK